MKSTAIFLSAAALTLLSSVAMAHPELPPMTLTPAQLAAAQPAPSGPGIEHAVMVKEHVSRNAPTPYQQCKALEKRFDRNPAPAALKSAATPQGALRVEGSMLCKSQPHAAYRYLHAAIETLNAKWQPVDLRPHKS
jgi:hypothetical protein